MLSWRSCMLLPTRRLRGSTCRLWFSLHFALVSIVSFIAVFVRWFSEANAMRSTRVPSGKKKKKNGPQAETPQGKQKKNNEQNKKPKKRPLTFCINARTSMRRMRKVAVGHKVAPFFFFKLCIIVWCDREKSARGYMEDQIFNSSLPLRSNFLSSVALLQRLSSQSQFLSPFCEMQMWPCYEVNSSVFWLRTLF